MAYKIDIILLTFNNINNTKKCIDHLYKFTKNFGLVILDNNSTDGTQEYLKELCDQHDNITFFFSKYNLGIIKGRNRAYKLSKDAEYIIFLDSDQYVEEDWLESYLEMMKNYDVVGVEAWLMRERDFYPVKKIRSREEEFSYVGCGSLMIKRRVFEELGKFDERFFMYFEDPDFCWKAHEAGYKIGWNYNGVIIHNHPGPLLNSKTRKYFMNSWKKFKEKWNGKKLPVLKME